MSWTTTTVIPGARRIGALRSAATLGYQRQLRRLHAVRERRPNG